MSKHIKLPPAMKRRAAVKPGKGWRLVNPKKTGALKAALITTFSSAGEKYALFKLRD